MKFAQDFCLQETVHFRNLQIGKLDFTCCARGHQRFDTETSSYLETHCDKELLFPVVQKLINRKLRSLRKSSGRIELASERYLRATRSHYLSGFDGKDDHRSEESTETSLPAFLEMFKFQNANDNMAEGVLTGAMLKSPFFKAF